MSIPIGPPTSLFPRPICSQSSNLSPFQPLTKKWSHPLLPMNVCIFLLHITSLSTWNGWPGTLPIGRNSHHCLSRLLLSRAILISFQFSLVPKHWATHPETKLKHFHPLSEGHKEGTHADWMWAEGQVLVQQKWMTQGSGPSVHGAY